MTNTILITGALGEVGHSLIHHFLEQSTYNVVTTDLKEWDHSMPSLFEKKRLSHYQGDINDHTLLDSLYAKYHFDGVFHLAAILSSGGEKNPLKTHHVNVEGTLGLLERSQQQSLTTKKRTKFIFPSTIAVYGIQEGENTTNVKEDQSLSPITMYGINKMYIEQLGRYYSSHYKFTTLTDKDCLLDFRAVRFPGLLSAETVPTGGTSDYASEMIHSAAQNKPYECFVSPQATLPFMTMPDAVMALTKLFDADAKSLTQRTYNVSAFAVSAEQIAAMVHEYMPASSVTYNPTPKRELIVNSWPNSIDDQAARKDWGWSPRYNFEDAFSKYLIPSIQKHYS